ncbi:MAG TPA: helix-turn-helix domain-containing protein [Rhodothermales bacterium]|nr:helix-turn-helix domain-containing protein [Rhodothermales bacterium]HRR09067.1 helix-turn-helix domain-containing protein [Rhodothermales bacterium]
MGDFNHRGKIFYNPVEFALDQIGGTWKMPILWRLRNRVMRYSALHKDIPHISQKMLTTQLRELEQDGFVKRVVYPEVPPRVEYHLTSKGERAIEVITFIRNYGLELMQEVGIEA